MNIIDVALAAFTEGAATSEDQASAMAAKEQTEFLHAARGCARKTISPDAADLGWRYVPTDALPEQVEEARAFLAPGRPEYLRYRAEYGEDTSVISLDLVEPRQADRISPVTSLYHLGQLLTPATGTTHGPDKEQAEQPGPLAGVEQAQQRAAQVAALARRLLSEHPDSGLIADTASVFGHRDGDGSAELHLSVDDLDALSRIAAALGAEVTGRVSGTHPSMVLEHGDATCTVDDVTVHLRAYNKLPKDQAAAWLAQQNLSTAEASDGGDR
jgi:hypothetical protein